MRHDVPTEIRPVKDLSRATEAAWLALRTDRTRTRAAVVAMTIAMAIVVCLATLVESGRAATIRALEAAGLNNLYLVNRPSSSSARDPATRLTVLQAVKVKNLFAARQAVFLRTARRAVVARGAPFPASVYGVSGPAAAVIRLRARSGRMLGDLDFSRKSSYCVVGSAIPKLAGLPGSVGEILRVGGRTFQIVGELVPVASEAATAGEVPSLDWDRAVLVPLGAEPEASGEPDERYPIDLAALTFPSSGEAEAAAAALAKFPNAGFRAASPVQTLRQYRQTRRTFDRIVWLVVLLTACSAVMAVSNLLSASVAARTREIGLRRAVGARSRDIVLQFEVEGLLLGLLGGAAGLAAGAAFALLLPREGGGTALSFLAFAFLALSAVAAGIVTGIRPAFRASRVDPAQALREG